MLKKVLFLAFFAFVFVLAGCRRDKEVVARKAIIGEWKVDKILFNGTITEDDGSFKFRKKEFVLSDYNYVVNKDEVQEIVRTKADGSEEVLGYEFFEGSTDMILTFFSQDGRPSNVFIELMTRDVLIFSDGGTPSSKYFLSK